MRLILDAKFDDDPLPESILQTLRKGVCLMIETLWKLV